MKGRVYKEINNLCKTLNNIPGVKVSQGSVVNGLIYIWFRVYDQKLLFPIARAVNNRYGCIHFHLNVEINDMPGYIGYVLQSKSDDLSLSLVEADKMSLFIERYMKDKDIIKFCGMDKVIEEFKVVTRDKIISDLGI